MSHPTTSFSSLISQIVDSHSETEEIQAIHSLGWGILAMHYMSY